MSEISFPPTFVPGFHDDENAIKKLKFSRLGITEMILSNFGFGSSWFGKIFFVVEKVSLLKDLF